MEQARSIGDKGPAAGERVIGEAAAEEAAGGNGSSKWKAEEVIAAEFAVDVGAETACLGAETA